MVERYSDGSGGSMVTRFMLVRPIEIRCRVGCVTRGRRDICQLMPDVLVVKVGLCALSLWHLASMWEGGCLWPDFIPQSLLTLRGQLTLEPL